MSYERINRIRGLMRNAKSRINSSEMGEIARLIPGCGDQLRQVNNTLSEIETMLQEIPRIDVALLGPSRHGKSTLINALAGADLLPTSDIKPCTASIVKLQYADSWSAEVQFVSRDILVEEWGQSVRDAMDYLRRFENQDATEEAPDNPRYLFDLLQRFIELFHIDTNCDSRTLVERVRGSVIPGEQKKLLGNVATKKAQDFTELKGIAEKYLSTKDVLWTIVDSCTLRGPFQGWNSRLGIVDLPGTNDTNAAVRRNSHADSGNGTRYIGSHDCFRYRRKSGSECNGPDVAEPAVVRYWKSVTGVNLPDPGAIVDGTTRRVVKDAADPLHLGNRQKWSSDNQKLAGKTFTIDCDTARQFRIACDGRSTNGQVDLKTGVEAEVKVRMQKKGTEMIGDGKEEKADEGRASGVEA